MGNWEISISNEKTKKEIQSLKKKDPPYFKKLERNINELRNNLFPKSNKWEQLKYYDVPTYSWRLDKNNRIVYHVDKNTIFILSVMGHYSDK